VLRQELGPVNGAVELPLTLPSVGGMYVLRFRQPGVMLTQKVVLTP